MLNTRLYVGKRPIFLCATHSVERGPDWVGLVPVREPPQLPHVHPHELEQLLALEPSEELRRWIDLVVVLAVRETIISCRSPPSHGAVS